MPNLLDDLNNVADSIGNFLTGKNSSQPTSQPDEPGSVPAQEPSGLPGFLEDAASSIGNWFSSTADRVGKTLKSQVPTQDQINSSESPIAKTVLTKVAPGIQSFIEGGASKYFADMNTADQKAQADQAAWQKTFDAAKAGGASDWELNKLASQSPNNKKMNDMMMGFMNPEGGMIDDVGKQVLSSMASETNPEVIGNTLKSLGVPDDLLGTLAEKISKVSDEAGVTKIIKDSGLLERSFISSVKNAYGEVQQIAGQYIPRSTDELATKAKNFVSDDLEAAHAFALNNSDDRAVATASELIKHYGEQAAMAADTATKAAFEDKMAEVANNIAPKLTEAGRTVQAASILGRMTPEGAVRFAAGEISRYNATIDAGKGGMLNFSQKIPELTGQVASDIMKKATDLQTIVDPVQKAQATKDLMDQITDLVPTPWWKKAVAVWKAGMLTGIKTSGTILGSGFVNNLAEVAKDVPATAVDSIASLFTGERTLALTTKGLAGGLEDGLKSGWQYIKTGQGMDSAYDFKGINFGDSPLAKTIQGYEQTIFRAIGSEHQVYYYGAKARSLYSQATAQGMTMGLKSDELAEFVSNLVKNPTDDMLKYAAVDAETAVFRNATAIGKGFSKLKSTLGKEGGALGGIAGEVVAPFVQTPSAMLMQMVNYSPVGIVKTIAENIGAGNFDQRLFAQGIGRGLTGTGIMYVGSQLMKNNLISLDYPTDARTQEQWKAEGRIPNSINIGGKWRAFSSIGPVGSVLLIGAHLQDALKQNGSVTGAVQQAVFGGLKSFLENPFLQGVSNFSDALNDPARYGQAYFGNLLGSGVPTIVNDVANATDTGPKRARSIMERVQSRIPFLREQLQPQVDVYGNTVQKGGNFLETMVDPTRPSAAIDNPVIGEVRRLSDQGYKVSPTILGTKDGYSSLTPEENTQLLQRAGQITETKMGSLITSQQYQSLSDEDKAKAIDDFANKSKDMARVEVVIQKTQGLQGQDLVDELKVLKSSGLMTASIYKDYMKMR